MDTEFDNRDAPTYLAHYGMHRPPFATRTEDEMYYSEPTRNKRLDILLHLTQYGNELLLVTGPEGIGKSTLLHQFLKKAPSNWKICRLNAQAKIDVEQLLYRICHCLNLPVETGTTGVMTSSIKRQLDQLLARTKTVAIIIDDAHMLSNECLLVLTELAKIKNPHSGAIMRIILLAEPQIKIQFASFELENKLKYPTRKIDLPPFDEIHTGELIRHRTRTAGLVADSTFTDAAIAKIYKQSEGIPGNIVELAHRVLFEMTPLKRRTKPKPMAVPAEEKTKRPIGLIATLIAVILIAVLLMFQDDINRLYSQKETSRQIGASEHKITTTLAIPTLEEQKQSAEADTFDGLIEEQIYSTETNASDGEVLVATIGETNELNSPPNTLNSAQTTPSISPRAESDREQQPPLVRNIHQETWLLEQKPDYYTLQLVAGYQKSTVNNYLRRHKLPATELAYYRSINKGNDWHSLVFGIFPDYGSAKLAIDGLPSKVRQSKPWIRRLKNIQKEIKEAAGN
ncbi:AAA family ATPase [Kaarinaea lacus]